jgi:hypothetical protein
MPNTNVVRGISNENYNVQSLSLFWITAIIYQRFTLNVNFGVRSGALYPLFHMAIKSKQYFPKNDVLYKTC